MKEILTAWQWDGPVSEPIPYGEGHINQTYAITVTSEQGAKRYILQKINTDTFKDPAGLMENICGVTDFLREKAKQRGADPARATLHVVPTKEGRPYYQAADGGCWKSIREDIWDERNYDRVALGRLRVRTGSLRRGAY